MASMRQVPRPTATISLVAPIHIVLIELLIAFSVSSPVIIGLVSTLSALLRSYSRCSRCYGSPRSRFFSYSARCALWRRFVESGSYAVVAAGEPSLDVGFQFRREAGEMVYIEGCICATHFSYATTARNHQRPSHRLLREYQ
ncbi:hypothetical protein DFH09DRAFT_1146584 [Mycena vulgaris]|nr:hypothetical protein DFH09DRAFT_1146584 [Mycena vulgaris]